MLADRHSGMVRRTRPQMCNCTSGNLEIPGSRLRRALSDKRYALARGMTATVVDANYFCGFGWRRAVTPFSLRESRLTRASTKRSRILTMTPRCFLAIGGSGPRRIGGEIFSNVKAGIVYPLGAELKHPWNFPRSRWNKRRSRQSVPPVFLFEHDLFRKTGIHFSGSCSV